MRLTRDVPALRQAARAELDEVFAQRLALVLGPMAAMHQRKTAEAQAVLAGASSPLLAAEARARGVTEAALAEEVIRRGASQAAVLADIEVERQRAQARLDAASNPFEIEDIMVPHRSRS